MVYRAASFLHLQPSILLSILPSILFSIQPSILFSLGLCLELQARILVPSNPQVDAKTAEEGSPADIEAPHNPGWAKVSLANGDQLRVKVEGIDEKVLVAFSEEFDATMTFPSRRVLKVEFEHTNQLVNAGGLVLRDSSLLVGRLTDLQSGTVEFDLAASRAEIDGSEDKPATPILVNLPRKEVVAFVPIRESQRSWSRLESNKSSATDSSRSNTVWLTNGSRLSGKISQPKKGVLRVTQGGMESECQLAEVAQLGLQESSTHFAWPSNADLRVRFVDGMNVVGERLEVNDGVAKVTLSAGPTVFRPLTEVLDVEYYHSLELRQRALLWTMFTTRSSKVKDLLEKKLKGWELKTISDESFGLEFAEALFQSRTLIVPHMERYDGKKGTDLLARTQLRPLLHDFLERGGNIVFLGLERKHEIFFNHLDFFHLEALFGASTPGDVPYTEAGKPFSKGLNTPMPITKTTYFYFWKGEGVEAWALEKERSRAPVLSKRIGNGRVIVMGMTFSEVNGDTAILLDNAVKYTEPAPEAGAQKPEAKPKPELPSEQ